MYSRMALSQLYKTKNAILFMKDFVEADGSNFYLIWTRAIKAITASIHLTEVEVFRFASRCNAIDRIVTIC